jgi:integrase
MEKDIFPFIGQRPIEQIEPLELLTVLQRLRKGVLWSKPVRSAAVVVKFYVMPSPPDGLNITLHLTWLLRSTSLKATFPFLTESELPAFVSDLENYQGSLVTKYATQLLMLTGVRTIELRAAEWAEFDLENALWEIPKERMKKRRPHLVPLSTQALAS